MRELMGKIPSKDDPNVIEKVYLSEIVRCHKCQRTAPIGIEVVTIKKDGESKKVVRRGCYCRAHGHDYEMRLQSLPISRVESSRMSGLRRVETARRLLLERTDMRADKDVQFRSIHESPLRAMVTPKAVVITN